MTASSFGRLAAALALSLSGIAVSLVTPAIVAAQGPTFGEPTGTAPLGGSLTVIGDIDGVNGGNVELLVRLEGTAPQVVIAATPGTVAGQWQATSEIDV